MKPEIGSRGVAVSARAFLRKSVRRNTLLRLAAGFIILSGLWLLSTYDYLLFHAVVELAAVTVALAIFIIVWNMRRTITEPFFLLTGIAFFFIGILDLLHTLAYKGMGVFPGNSSDLPTQLWIAARYFQAGAFFVAALLAGRSITRRNTREAGLFFLVCAAVTGILLSGIFLGMFPQAFIEGSGLTPFKIGSEYLISLVMLATILVLVLKRKAFDGPVFASLVTAQAFLIAGELAFTSYASVYGFMNMLGHLFRLCSVYFFYRAIVVVSLTRPLDTLYRNLRKSEEATRESNTVLEAILGAAKESIYLFDAGGHVLSANPTALERLGGRSAGEVTGRHFSEFIPPETARHRQEYFDRVLNGKEPVRFEDVRDGIVFDHSFFPVFDSAGSVARVAVFSRDITARKKAENELVHRNEDLNALNEELMAMQEELRAANEELYRSQEELTRYNSELLALNRELSSTRDELEKSLREISVREQDLSEKKQQLETALAEKEILLSEIHHRVKNNMASFISLLSLGGTGDDSPAGTALRQDLQNRARSMALIHETLYRTRTFSRVDMGLYLKNLADQIADTYRSAVPVTMSVDADGVSLDLARATPCGLIVNEILTNSFKYAFPPGFDCRAVRSEPCTIRLSLRLVDGEYVLTAGDNGIGLPPSIDIAATKSLGLRLVSFLARHQLQATVAVKADRGTEFTIRFPKEPDRTS